MNQVEVQALRFSLESALLNARRIGAIAASDVEIAYQRGLEDACAHVLSIINGSGKSPISVA